MQNGNRSRVLSLIVLSLLLATGAFATRSPDRRPFCIGTDPPWPGYSADYYTVPVEYRRALYVVKARVTKETWLGDSGKPKPLKPPFQDGATRPWGFDPYMGAFYDVQVLRAFKGSPAGDLRLFSENSTGRFPMFVGRTYLLFVSSDHFEAPIDSQLTIDNCGNSVVLPMGNATLEQVERLPRSR